MFLIKFLGIFLLATVCSLIGILRGQSVKSRCKKLSLFYDGLQLFYEYITQGEYELDKAVKNAFGRCDFITLSNNNYVCQDNDLIRQDKLMIKDFFASLGHSSKKAECDRIKLCTALVQKRVKEAEVDMIQKCRLYSTFGVCIGLALSILLI